MITWKSWILWQSERQCLLETVESYSCCKSSCLEVNCAVSHFVLPVASLIVLFFCWSFSWGRAGRVLRWKRQRRRSHYSHVALLCVCNSSREPFSPPAPHVSTGSNAAHKMPVIILRKAFFFNKERHSRDHVGPVSLKALRSIMKGDFYGSTCWNIKKNVIICPNSLQTLIQL